ncbi:MAG TPA: PPC domain-containing protein [Fimbriiglobus sp.]|nr:PPC domain-containing protein [Fimbriiglobus sp.]
MTYLSPAGARQGTTVEVSAGGTFDKWPIEVWVSGEGVTGTAGKEKGKLTFTVAEDARPGTYWVRVHDKTGASGLRPFVVGTFAEVAENEAGKPQAVELPAVVNGRLAKAGDVDGFAVTLRKGQTLVAAVEAHHTLRSPIDAVLQVVSPDGFVLAQGNDHAGLDPLVAFPVPADGTYVVRVFAFPATPDSGIRFTGSDASVYRLTLTTGGYADYAWPLAIERGKPGKVALVGWNIPNGARAVPVKPEDDGPILVTHPRVINPVPVAVEPHPCWLASDAMKESDGLAPPFTVSGRFEKAGQVDRFHIIGTKSRALAIRCESPSLGLVAAPVVAVIGSDGKSLARAEPRRPDDDADGQFIPPADGTYTVEVRDLYGAHGPRHAYRLTVRPPQPDFALTVAADRIGCAPEKPSDVVVTVARRDGFSMDVSLTVEGLPDGVTAEVVAAKGKPNPGKRTLRFTADGAYKPGPVRIVGTSAGLTRAATAALPDFGTTTTDLWLSPGAAPPTAKKKRR